MKKEQIYDAIGDIDEGYIEQSEEYASKKKKSYIKWVAAAAGVLICIGAVGLGVENVKNRNEVVEAGTKVVYSPDYNMPLGMVDKLAYMSLEEELALSKGAFEGKIVSDTAQYGSQYSPGYTVYLVKVTKVLEGDYKVGDRILVKQGYFIGQGANGPACLQACFENPVNKGDKAIFIIGDKDNDNRDEPNWVLDKYPIPSKKVISMPKEQYTKEILGCENNTLILEYQDVVDIKRDIFDAICEKYYRK